MSIISSIFGKKETINHKQLVAEGALIVDVRSPAEFKGGHIKNSINIPLDTIPTQAAALKKHNKTIITCCRSGARSGMAVSALKTAGITAHNGGPWNEMEQKIK